MYTFVNIIHSCKYTFVKLNFLSLNRMLLQVDMNEEWIIPADGGESKCHWTPYAGWRVRGKVRTVVIRGEEVFIDGRFINQPGFGKNVRLMTDGNANTDFDEFAAETEGGKFYYVLDILSKKMRFFNHSRIH